MRVSVVIPTYNSGPLVVEAVESVLAQTRPAHEVIVVDDGSTDDTADRMARFGHRIRYVRQENARVAVARNTGIAAATGDVIAFLDADDVWHPQKLARQIAVLDAEPAIGLLATHMFAWPGEIPSLGSVPTTAVTRLGTADMLPNNRLATSTVAVRKAVLDRVGGFDRELFGPEDYDLWLRCGLVTEVAIMSETLTGYRDTPGSLGKQAETMYRGLTRIHAKLGEAGVWEGRGWLRRKCTAHVEYTTAYMLCAGGRPRSAVGMLARSLCHYPVPMGPPDVKQPLARLRLLARAVASATGLVR